MLDAMLSMAHWWVVLGMVSLLGFELAALRGVIDQDAVKRLARIDAAYGLMAGLILIAGFSRAIFGAKGWAFYSGNPMFWVKIGLFALMGLISILPTVQIIRWRKELANGAGVIDAGRTASVRRWVHGELTLLIPIPIAAALMARGIGF